MGYASFELERSTFLPPASQPPIDVFFKAIQISCVLCVTYCEEGVPKNRFYTEYIQHVCIMCRKWKWVQKCILGRNTYFLI